METNHTNCPMCVAAGITWPAGWEFGSKLDGIVDEYAMVIIETPGLIPYQNHVNFATIASTIAKCVTRAASPEPISSPRRHEGDGKESREGVLPPLLTTKQCISALKTIMRVLEWEDETIDGFHEYAQRYGGSPGGNVFEFVLRDANKLRSQPPIAAAGSPWIELKDGCAMPEYGVDVWLWCTSGYGHSYADHGEFYFHHPQEAIAEQVTHWQPIIPPAALPSPGETK